MNKEKHKFDSSQFDWWVEELAMATQSAVPYLQELSQQKHWGERHKMEYKVLVNWLVTTSTMVTLRMFL